MQNARISIHEAVANGTANNVYRTAPSVDNFVLDDAA